MRTLCALLVLLLIAGPVLAGEHHVDAPLAFSPVPDYGASVERLRLPPMDGRIWSVVSEVRDRPVVATTRASRPVVSLPTNPPRSIPTRARPISGSAHGVASWYCGHGSACTSGYPGGLYAAAGPSLRVGDWRGRTVTVHAAGRAIRVRLIDWCACPKRVMDLYSDAFSRLAPLNRGLLKVEVTW